MSMWKDVVPFSTLALRFGDGKVVAFSGDNIAQGGVLHEVRDGTVTITFVDVTTVDVEYIVDRGTK